MDHLAREGDADGGVTPLKGPVVLATHFLQEERLSGVLAVSDDTIPTALQCDDEAFVDRGSGGDPLVVSAGQGVWQVEPVPHHDTRSGSKDEGVGHL